MMNQDVHHGRWHSALGTPKTVSSRAAAPWVIAGLADAQRACQPDRWPPGPYGSLRVRACRRLRTSVERYYNAPLKFVAPIQAMFAGKAADVAVWLRRHVTAGTRHVVVRLAVDDHERALAEFADHVLPLLRMGELA